MTDLRLLFKQNLIALRERTGNTHESLAAAVGVKKGTIQRWESGSFWPEYDNLEALASALGVDVPDFFAGMQPPVAPTAEAILKLVGARDKKILRLTRDLEAKTKVVIPKTEEGLKKLDPDKMKDSELKDWIFGFASALKPEGLRATLWQAIASMEEQREEDAEASASDDEQATS